MAAALRPPAARAMVAAHQQFGARGLALTAEYCGSAGEKRRMKAARLSSLGDQLQLLDHRRHGLSGRGEGPGERRHKQAQGAKHAPEFIQ